MFSEKKVLEKLLNTGRIMIPRQLFEFLRPAYHWTLSILGGVVFGFPSRRLKIIAVTGTKGKSTTVFMIAKVFEDQGLAVAAVGSLGFKIKEKEWPNDLKMTLPGRLKLQKFLARAKKAGAEYVVLEATSEGIAQHRLAGIKIDCAVFTNLHKEHIESHGSFENYIKAKQKLFLKVKNTHILNIEDPYYERFANFPAKHRITYGKKWGSINISTFEKSPTGLDLQLLGDFNENNALAALAVASAYNLDIPRALKVLRGIESIPGRMEMIESPNGFKVVVDYAHTPDSLEKVYRNLKNMVRTNQASGELICVLGAAGGGRDKWKRLEFGRIASQFCDKIILTNEDPYDEDPLSIIDQVAKGAKLAQGTQSNSTEHPEVVKILDRGRAIASALTKAKSGYIVVITGKGSETSIAVSGGRKIPWSDKEEIFKNLESSNARN